MTYQDMTDAELAGLYGEAEENLGEEDGDWWEVMEDIQAEMDRRAGL